jgi:hypothetical protein
VVEPGSLLFFRYTNWKFEPHDYVVQVESVVWAPYPGADSSQDPEWLLNGKIVTRDGDARPEINPNRRRTFKMAEMSEVQPK